MGEEMQAYRGLSDLPKVMQQQSWYLSLESSESRAPHHSAPYSALKWFNASNSVKNLGHKQYQGQNSEAPHQES